MRYIIEWKLILNKRAAAKQTEENLVVAPSDFWSQELASKIADIVQSKGKQELLDWVQVRRVGWQVKQYDPCILTHLLYSLRVMK
jgi:hypothetical protein